ncbi:hypothetical protein FMEXI_5092 [Fusarium mexicanum]|uniref:Uncharacterized protein n=1 Tax=Fusarium mexicanum TaxID=751941 RepID=A0A8H5J3V9_9HYPO|nr:hypothetical protein FMEXI_5092 [Fusarium mexicanum]
MLQQELTSAFSAFTAANSGHPSRLKALKSFLEARPQVKPVTDLLPVNIDETNVRLDLIEIVRNKMVLLKPDRPLNHIQFCYLIGMSLGDLRAFAYSGPGHVVKTIRGLEKLTAYFCHIVLFAWNQTQEHLEKTRKVLGKVDYFIFEKTAEAGGTNMEIIKGYHDATLCEDDPNYSIISLQFVWMPCNVKALATEQVDLAAQRDPSTALGSHLDHRYGQGPLSACTTRNCTKCREILGIQCHDISSNLPVESGTIVKVRRLTKHRGLFEHVIKLQWSITCAAAMSGGAQIYEDELLSDSEHSLCGSVPEQQDLEESGEELKEAGENSRQASIEKFESWLQQSESADDMGT